MLFQKQTFIFENSDAIKAPNSWQQYSEQRVKIIIKELVLFSFNFYEKIIYPILRAVQFEKISVLNNFYYKARVKYLKVYISFHIQD